MTFLDLFSETATTYASARPTYPDALVARLAALALATDLAWDCATGTGQAGAAAHSPGAEISAAAPNQCVRASGAQLGCGLRQHVVRDCRFPTIER
jgi:hypothetical protein